MILINIFISKKYLFIYNSRELYYLRIITMRENGKSHFWMGLSLIWCSHLLMDFMLGVWPVYKTMANLDLVVAGLIASLSIFIGEGLQLYFGYLSDRGHQQKLLTLGIGLTATIPFLSYVENEWLLFIMIACAYVGSGAFHPSGTGLVLNKAKSKSSFIAFFACGGMVGAASSQILYTFLYYRFEGQTWFLALPILFCTLGCAFFTFPQREGQSQDINFKQVLQALRPLKHQLSLLYIIHVLLQVVVMSFTFLLPDMLKVKGYEEWFCLGGGYFCFIMGAVLTSIPIGYCVDKIGYRLVLTAIVVASTSLLYVFLALESLSLIPPIFLLFLLGGTMGVFIPVVVAGGTENVPAYTRSFVSALYMGGTTCLAGFGPILASLLASFFDDQQAAVTALQTLSSLYIVSLILIYYLPDSVLALQQEPQLVKVAHLSQGDNR